MMDKPNVLMLLSDEHSYRFMGHVPSEEGGEPAHTPSFDWLAQNGVRFAETYCQVPLCTPSRMCLLTGLEARACGAWWNDSVLRPDIATLPGTLSEAGYETCLVGKMHLSGVNQFAGFRRRPYGDLTGQTGHQWEPLSGAEIGPYSMRFRTAEAGITEIPESQIQEQIVAEEGLSFLREHVHSEPSQPWFLCLSFSRPHFPLTAPTRHFSRYLQGGITKPKVGAAGDAYNHPMSVGMRAGYQVDKISDDEMMNARTGYFACVSYLDEIVGDLLARMEREGHLDNTIIIYTSDHGEMAGEHGVWWKQSWYEASTRVPLLVSLPEHRSGECAATVEQTPAALVDLFPTICALTGTQYNENLDGVDLSAVLGGTRALKDRPIVSDNLVPRWGAGTEFRMVRWGSYKYVCFRDVPNLLFDLEADPDEQHDLSASESPKIQEVCRKMELFVHDTMDFEDAEQERLGRDGSLLDEYRLGTEAKSTGNLYLMSTGQLVNAEDMLYSPTVVLKDPDKILIGKPTLSG